MLTVKGLREYLAGQEDDLPVVFRTQDAEYPFFDGPPHLEAVLLDEEAETVAEALVFSSGEPADEAFGYRLEDPDAD